MEDLKEYLNEDASEEERQAAQQISEGLAALRLQEKVRAAAMERAKWQSRRWWLWSSLVSLLIIAGTLGLWKNYTKGELSDRTSNDAVQEEKAPTPSDSINVQHSQETPMPVIEEPSEESVKPEEPANPPSNIPIAQSSPDPALPPPAYDAPDTYLRGQNEEQENKALLDQLWYTTYPLIGLRPGEQFTTIDQLLRERSFPTAYVRLQRLDRLSTPNDTLRYLQAYTLLEMGQGEEAIRLFDQLTKPPSAWQTQITWYRGLASLLSDDTNAALLFFREIATQPNHPYYLQAKKALELYE